MKKSEKLTKQKISKKTIFQMMPPVCVWVIGGYMIWEIILTKVLEFLSGRKKDGYIDTSKVMKHLAIEESTIKRLIDIGYVEKLPTKKYSKKIMITEKGIEYLIAVKEKQIMIREKGLEYFMEVNEKQNKDAEKRNG